MSVVDAMACAAPGPWIRTSPSYESQVVCNRVLGHDGPHRCYSRDTFAVRAEWHDVAVKDERTRRRVT